MVNQVCIPTQSVGTRDMNSHAGAWELGRAELWFPRSRVVTPIEQGNIHTAENGTFSLLTVGIYVDMNSHAGAWELGRSELWFPRSRVVTPKAMNLDLASLSDLEKEGIIQRFAITLELSWKTLKDYLENEGYDQVKNGKQAIRQAFQDEIITDAENWMEALKKRNLTSHTYNKKILEEMLGFLESIFYPLVRALYFNLKKEL